MAGNSQDPLSGGGGSGDPIGDQFNVINKMVGGGKAPGAGGAIDPTNPAIKTEDTSGGNSLDQITRSITNLLSGQGQSTFQAGSGILDQGQKITGQGQQMLGQGEGVFKGGLQTFQPSLDYWNAILSGDPTKVQQYIAPMASQISDAYAGAKSAADQQLPVGGGRSATMANLPFQQAGDVAKLYQGLEPTAANAISGIASQISNLALGQEGVALGQEGTGISQQGVGISEQNVGLQQLMAAIQSLLGRRGQNIQETGNLEQMVGQMAQAATAPFHFGTP